MDLKEPAAAVPEGAVVDMKAALRPGAKPDTTHCRYSFRVYCARACEYGNDKYERANYLRPTKGTADDFKRLRAYTRACIDHLEKMLSSMERHQAIDPRLENQEGMRAAVYAPDTDPGNDKVGPSNLPHMAHAAASIMMAIEQATGCGLLPVDPGVTWERK